MRVEINPKYKDLQTQIEKIPLLFESKGEVVYEGRNVLKRAFINDIDVVVKSFKKPHIVNRVVYSYFRKSKAERSFVYSNAIIQHGFRSPEPIAVIEQYCLGLLTSSYYICRYESGETVRYLMDGIVAGNEAELKAFARYTAALHIAGILHLDYSPGNIIIEPDQNGGYVFSLVDVNRLRLMSSIDIETACQNVCRLCTSQEVLAFIMREYAICRGWDIEKTVALSTYYSEKFFRKYTFRRAARKERGNHIVSRILLFRFSRTCRGLLPSQSQLSVWLLKKEKNIYDSYLRKYDYQNLYHQEYD